MYFPKHQNDSLKSTSRLFSTKSVSSKYVSYAKKFGAFTVGALGWAAVWSAYKAFTFQPHENYGPSTSVLLPSKRQISFVSMGPTDAKNVIFAFHGLGGSRLFPISVGLDDPKLLSETSTRIIAVDRCGYGNSDSNPHATLESTIDDVVALANKLNVDKFSLVGMGIGGAYAYAAAYYIPKQYPGRLQTVAVISGESKFDPKSWLTTLFTNSMAAYATRVGLSLYRYFIYSRPYAKLRWSLITNDSLKESSSLRRKTFDAQFVLMDQEGLKKGTDGVVTDIKVVRSKPWGFELKDIAHEKMLIWHGEADKVVDVLQAKHACSAIAKSKCFILPTYGHWMIADQWETIVKQILEENNRCE